MKEKTLKRISLISVAIIVALALALVGVMHLSNSQPKAQAAAGTLYKAEYQGENGTTAAHLQLADMRQKYDNLADSNIYQISTGAELYNFLNGIVNRKVGFLTKDVYLSYNSDRSGYDRVNVNSSNAIFQSGRVLDGNGYTINIYGGSGNAGGTNDSDKITAVTDETRATYGRQGEKYDGTNVWYEYTGFLVAQNYGTIKDCTINYNSPHTNIEADKGQTGKDVIGALGMDATNKILSSQEGMLCAGIITGLNGYGGSIDNVKLNVTSAFTVVKKEGTKHGWYLENGCYAGAIAGRAENNSVINNCWVDLASGTGVFAGAQGQGGLSTDDRTSFAVAGGLVGNLDSGTGKITYCALTGTGAVKAFGNRAPKAAYFKIYAGGVVGGCVKIGGNMSILDCYGDNEDPQLQYGQIQGIISSWTGSRFTNMDNNSKETFGSLFGAVGTDDNILSVALLYSLETLAETNVNPNAGFCQIEHFKASDGKFVLDSAMKFKNWVEINPTTDGGYITAKFDMENPAFDIRVHIVADGHDDFSESEMDAYDLNGASYYQYKMHTGDSGGFIWSGKFESANDSSNHISLILDDPIYAEIYMISSKKSGKYNYEFGRMGILEYTDTNGENGKLVKPYNGAADPLQLPTVTMTNYPAFSSDVFKNESLWNITRSDKKIALSQAYMPGTYRMKVETKLGQRTYGYYSEEQRMLAWQPTSDYLFTILQGELKFGNGTTTTDGWQEYVTFELIMNSRTDFDRFEFQRNGVFPADSAKNFINNIATAEGYGARYTVNKTTLPAGTGKNGTSYTFYAYKQDALTGEYVVVAVSESVTVRIDNEAPEVSEIEYYMIEDGEERLLSEDEVEALQYDEFANDQKQWTKNQILAKFSVSDNKKSGIAIAATGAYIDETVLSNDGDRAVVVTISDSNPMSLYYVDASGNTTTVDLHFNVDRVQGKLKFAGTSYSNTGRFNYSTQNVSVFYRADFGASGWKLWYSYQRDEQGNDIWLPSDTLSTADSGAVKTFTIDWNMGDVITGKGDDFKLKMVNEVGLYDEVIAGDPQKDYVIGSYVIWLRIANIYIDTNLNNIFVDDNGVTKTVEEILQDEEEKSKFFDKQYDGTDEYDGKKEYKFYTDLSKLNTSPFFFDEEDHKLGVIYSPAGMFSRPKINVGNKGIVPVQLKYASTEVGDTKLSFQVVLEGTDGYNYIVYFTDLMAINFYEDVEVAEDTYRESVEIDAKINKLQVTIELSEQEAFNGSITYYYGDEVPTEIEVYVEQTDQYVTVQIETQASSTANFGEYAVKGINPNGYNNIEYNVNSTNIKIERKLVSVDLRFDGGEIGNIPTGVKAGRTHAITGTYTDVNGETQKANVEYTLDDKPVNALGAVGLYTVNLSLPDGNYEIDGQSSFKFNIARGQLEIETGLRVKDFTEGDVEYDLIIPEESKELYEEEDVQVTYYKYLDGAVYNAADRKVYGKVSDDAMTSYPTERGYYFVKVEFVTKDNPNFFPKNDYAEGYLVITSAQTKVNVEKVVLDYSFTSEKFTFDLVKAVAEVRSSSNKQLWSASSPAEGVVKVQYKDSDGTFKDVAAKPNEGGGWYSETGRYEYKIKYLGNDDYNESSIDVVMVINEAELTGITFNPVEVVYDGNNHLPTVGGLLNYTGLKVTLQYNVNIIYCDGTEVNEALKQFTFKDAREYTVYMSVDKSGYATKELQTKVVIKKAKMENISASIVDVVYDGKRHGVTFTGPDLVYSNGSYQYKGETVLIKSGNTDGNAFATNVRIEEGVGPSYYSGEVTLSSANYEDLVVKTNITIRQALLPYKEIGNTLPKKLPSGLSLSEYKGHYVDENGTTVECALQYRDRKGNVVELDEDGKLPDGRYTVVLVLTDSNYYLDRYWNLDVGEINSAEISIYGGIAIGAVGVLMVGAIVTAIVVVKKRKKAGIV
ncbi:MAG: hypothetical protein K2M75_05440 [Clostridia bacterium]|nr:hypothetical protein [Clostridia bacterium]